MSADFAGFQIYPEETLSILRESQKWNFVPGGREVPDLDCLGFLLLLLNRRGINVEVEDNRKNFVWWDLLDKSEEFSNGKILLFNYPETFHIGIMIGPVKFLSWDVHGMEIANIATSNKYKRRLQGIYEINDKVLSQSI